MQSAGDIAITRRGCPWCPGDSCAASSVCTVLYAVSVCARSTTRGPRGELVRSAKPTAGQFVCMRVVLSISLDIPTHSRAACIDRAIGLPVTPVDILYDATACSSPSFKLPVALLTAATIAKRHAIDLPVQFATSWGTRTWKLTLQSVSRPVPEISGVLRACWPFTLVSVLYS